jgi:outer membrane protein assembly factor BamB
MHNIKRESPQEDSPVKEMKWQSGEESRSLPFQDREVQHKKLKLSHNWQYILTGGTILLVFIVIFAGVISSRSQTPKQPARSVPLQVPTAITGSVSPRIIPAPKTKPIPSPVGSDHNVSMTVVDGVAYAGTYDNAVYALRSSNGSLLWHTRVNGAVEESPVVLNGIVYVSSFVEQTGPAYLSALRADDGMMLWQYSSQSYINTPVIGDGVIYIAPQSDQVIALRAGDGKSLWHFTAPQSFSYQIKSLFNGVLYVIAGTNGLSSTVYALRASNGTVLWRYTTDGLEDMFMSPDGGAVYVFSQSKLSALRAGDGHQLWSQPIDTTFDQSPQIIDGVIYLMATKISLETPTARSVSSLPQALAFGTLLLGNGQAATTTKQVPLEATKPLKEGKSTLYAIRASDGTMLWQYPMNNGGNSFAGWLKVADGVVYTSIVIPGNNDNTGSIAALRSSDGKILWQDKITGSPSGVLLADGTIYTGVDASSSAVYALRARDGVLLWGYPVSGTLFGDPVLFNTTVYFGAGNGMAYALRADNGAVVWHYLTDVSS